MAPLLIRRLQTSNPALYLTFDDGPDPAGTKPVLEILKRHDARATFFLIGEKAAEHADLALRISEAGHAVGNHSVDHRYRNYFRGSRGIAEWIESGEEIIRHVTGRPTIGFRPPAGVRTPALHLAVRRLNMPMILWNERFYDAVRPWPRIAAEKSLERIRAGDIVLLHDRQRKENLPLFLETLDFYIRSAQKRGFRLEALPCREIIASEVTSSKRYPMQ